MFPQQKRDARVDIFYSKITYQYLHLLIINKSYLNWTCHPRPGQIILTLVIIIDNTILSIQSAGRTSLKLNKEKEDLVCLKQSRAIYMNLSYQIG